MHTPKDNRSHSSSLLLPYRQKYSIPYPRTATDWQCGFSSPRARAYSTFLRSYCKMQMKAAVWKVKSNTMHPS